jgi:hypothetical protein
MNSNPQILHLERTAPIARLGGRPAVGGVIAKDLYTYSIKILRQEKIIRDHGREAVCERYRSAS